MTLEVPGSWISKIAEHEQHLLLGVSVLTCKVSKKSKGKDPRTELSSTGREEFGHGSHGTKVCFHRKLEIP